MTNEEFIGNILALLEEKRGIQKGFDYITTTRVLLTYELPLNEIVLDFYDRLKSISRGYASLDYHLAGYREADLVRLRYAGRGRAGGRALIDCPQRIRLHTRARFGGKDAEADSAPAFRSPDSSRRRQPRHCARNDQGARQERARKCYGGDISRKRKLLEKQKEGKKRMKRVGKVDIPQEAFLAVLKVND